MREEEDVKLALELLANKRLVMWCLKESEMLCRDGISWNAAVENQVPPEKLDSTIAYQRKNWQPLLSDALGGRLPKLSDFGKKLDWHYYPLEGVVGHIMGNAYGRMQNSLREIFPDIPFDVSPFFWTIKNVSDEEFSQRISAFLEAEHEKKKKECEGRPKDFARYNR